MIGQPKRAPNTFCDKTCQNNKNESVPWCQCEHGNPFSLFDVFEMTENLTNFIKLIFANT